jgi:hypothetical protein
VSKPLKLPPSKPTGRGVFPTPFLARYVRMYMCLNIYVHICHYILLSHSFLKMSVSFDFYINVISVDPSYVML